MILIVAMNYRTVFNAKQVVAEAYEGVRKEQINLEKIQHNLLKIYLEINLFLLNPLQKDVENSIDLHIKNSTKLSRLLKVSSHPFHQDLAGEVNQMEELFHQLSREVEALMKVRMDINKQYPGMAISANEMPKFQDSIKSGLELLVNEVESGDMTVLSEELYPTLLKTRTLWESLVSQMRIYLANRFASFSLDIMESQSKTLNDIYLQLHKSLKKLEDIYREEDSFEGPEIVKRLRKDSHAWKMVFDKVKAVNETEKWRGDTFIMRTRVIPIIEKLNATMVDFDKELSLERENISKSLSKNQDTLTFLVIAIVVLLLVFILLILVSMEWLVFNPIERVTQALRSKAFDLELPNIEAVNTREVGGLVEAFIEMDAEVTQRQNALEHQALHDQLTGLPNRFMLNQRMEYQILHAERQKQPFTLYLMDLNNFKEVNDTLGHTAGDMLLVEFAERVRKLVRKTDTLARLGGDEFAVLLPETPKKETDALAEKILEITQEPFFIEKQKINIGVSIGITHYPDDGRDQLTLLQHADLAMYAAKSKHIGYSHYNQHENALSTERLELANELHNAVNEDQLSLFFQPKFDTQKQSLVGAEALLRWQHPKFGFISPERIIEIAEQIGIIHKLTDWILNKAVQQCAKWHYTGFNLSIAVNLSVRDLSNRLLTENVKKVLTANHLSSQYLTLEITENVMMENLAISLSVLQELNKMGVNLSIDDFGTGFSSLAYLKKLPVNELKIDKSFVIDMDSNNSDELIVQSTISLAHNLGLKVVAEGVENIEVMEMLKALKCDQVQGYYFSKPKSVEEFDRFLKKNSSDNVVYLNRSKV